jgi:hypothetical protein
MAAAVALVLVAGACGGKKKEVKSAPRVTTTTVPARYPLTGLPVDNPDDANRPVLTVKVENAPEARPQAGLEAADVVYEEQVEGGLTRYLAMFQSTDAEVVGPIRSLRPTDPEVVRPLGGLFAYSGGTPKFIGMLRATPLQDIGFDTKPGLYDKRRDKRAPHHIYSSTERLFSAAQRGLRPPPPLFTFAPVGQPFDLLAPPATKAGVRIGRTAIDYTWDAPSSTWKRSTNGTAHMLEDGSQLSATNVIVQFVPYQNSPGDFDVVGNPVPVASVVGNGDAWVLSGGRVVKGKWSKPAAEAVTAFTTATGAPVQFVPGRTWVLLVPVGSPASTQ